jgi:hypothetical protein
MATQLGLAPQVGFEPTTLRLQRNAGVWIRGFFVPVARVWTWYLVLFGKELSRDCPDVFDWRVLARRHYVFGATNNPRELACIPKARIERDDGRRFRIERSR